MAPALLVGEHVLGFELTWNVQFHTQDAPQNFLNGFTPLHHIRA